MFHDVIQNSPEWDILRRGRFTASTFKDLFMKETTAGYNNAIYKIVFERLTGESPASYSNEAMRRGTELEPEAREWYELETFTKVNNGGFFSNGDWIGASPDGLLGEDGIIEIKCPEYSTMISYLINKKLPSVYEWQVHGQLMVTGRKYCDFVAYHPKLPKLILRVNRDEEMCNILQKKLEHVIGVAEAIIRKIQR